MSHSFAIAGAGKVGKALARLLSRAGWEFVGAASRSLSSAREACTFAGGGRATTDAAEVTRPAELVFLTVPDDAIEGLCEELGRRDGFAEGSVVAHCSGALSSALLRGGCPSGVHVGSLHPMQSFATPEAAVRTLPGSVCCVEGDAAAVPLLQEAAAALGAEVLTVATEDKPLYHAAGCVASNYFVTLQNAALKISRAAGIERKAALRMMTPLLRGTLKNIEELGIPEALTGPIARGDAGTVRRHLDAIEAGIPELLALYKSLGRETVEVARRKGTLTGQAAEEILELLA